MAKSRVILARTPDGTPVAFGPYKSLTRLDNDRHTIRQAPGWRYEDAVILVSGADLPYRIGRAVAEEAADG